MTKRYRDELDLVRVEEGRPAGFHWRGRTYEVERVLGHWHEDAGWWRPVEGAPRRLERTDLWRVEARNGTPERGIYELTLRSGRWRLDRVWD